MKYVQVIDGTITKYSLPKTGTLQDGRVVSGYDKLSPEMLREEYWVPLEDEKPLYDEETEYLEIDEYEILSNKVILKYLVVKKPVKSVDDIKLEKITQSKSELAIYLRANPYIHVDGSKYTATSEKQALLASNILIYKMQVEAGISAKLEWNKTGEECNEYTIEALSVIAIGMADYVSPLIKKQQKYEVEVNNCSTLEELNSIPDIEW